MKENIKGILIGIALTISVFSVLGLAAAHTANIVEEAETTNNNYDQMHQGMQGHHMMHSEMYEGNHMGCNMMKNHEGLSFKEMDEDNDGLCDFCGMPVEECIETISDLDGHSCPMMKKWRE